MVFDFLIDTKLMNPHENSERRDIHRSRGAGPCRAGIGTDRWREREALELSQMPTPPLLRRGGGSNVASGPVATTVGGATGPAAGHHSA